MGRAEVLPGGVTAEDLVQAAITKTLSGVRAWDPTRVSLLGHLMGVVRSDLGHARHSAERASTVRAADAGPTDRQAGYGTTASEGVHKTTPEDLVAANAAIKAFKAHMRQKHADLAALLEIIVDEDVTEIPEQSRRLNLPRTRIYELRRRLRNATSAYLEALQRQEQASEKAGKAEKAEKAEKAIAHD